MEKANHVWCRDGGVRGAMVTMGVTAYSIFGRSYYPILTKVSKMMPTIFLLAPPYFLNFRCACGGVQFDNCLLNIIIKM
jgi:hypothetical protein